MSTEVFDPNPRRRASWNARRFFAQKDASDTSFGQQVNHRSLLIALALVTLIAASLGGGGSRYASYNLLVQLSAFFALGLHRAAFSKFWGDAPFIVRLLVAVSIMIPALQLVPVPQAFLVHLPGRELVLQSQALAQNEGWLPTSVDPIRTGVALSALIVPLTIIVLGWNMRRADLFTVGWIIVGIALINFLIGIPQVLSQDQEALLFPENQMPNVLFGLFANRNTTGVFLVLALSLAMYLPIPQRRPTVHPAVFWVRTLVVILLLVAVVLTRSRTALVLAAIPIMMGAIYFVKDLRHRMRLDRPTIFTAAIAAGCFFAVVIGSVLTVGTGRIGDTLERFEAVDDARAYIWDDASYSAERYWPAGSGIGTFDEVFQIDESLEHLTQKKAGRAHNDFLEAAIESGIFGIATIAAWLALIGYLSWRARKLHSRWIAWSGSIGLLAIALQSITDYPLRNLSMLCFAALLFVMLLRFSEPETEREQ